MNDKIPITRVLAEWFVLILGAAITVYGYKCFSELTGVSYKEGESIGEQIGIIILTGLPGYVFGSIPAGYMLARDTILKTGAVASFFGLATVSSIGISAEAMGAGAIIAGGPVIALTLLSGIIAFPFFLLRRILGIFFHTEASLGRAVRCIIILIMIALPTLGYILPVQILGGEEGAALGKITFVSCLIADSVLLVILLRARYKLKRQMNI